MKKCISILLLAVLLFSMNASGNKYNASAADKKLWVATDQIPSVSDVLEEEYFRLHNTLSGYACVFAPLNGTFQLTWDTNVEGTLSFTSSKPDIISIDQNGLMAGHKLEVNDPAYIKGTITKADGTTISSTIAAFCTFKDVMNTKDYYFIPVLWAYGQKVTSGYTDSNGNETGYFKPNESCTRAQVVTFLYRYFWRFLTEDTSSVQDFTDVKTDTYYYDAVKWAVANGITTGYTGKDGKPNGKFGPNDTCTRAQVVTFLYRAYTQLGYGDFSDVPDFSDVKPGSYYYFAVKWAVSHNITTGYTGTDKFGPDDKCTRAQVVTFMFRAQ